MNKKYLAMVAFYAVISVLLGLTVQRMFESGNENVSAVLKIDNASITEKIMESSDYTNQETESKLIISNPQDVVKKPEIVKYTVKLGDTLESISNNYLVNINTISQSNEISGSDALVEGKILEFPSIIGVLHKVKSGENLWDISSTYMVDVTDITNINNLEAPDKLKIDQEIIIPGVDSVKVVKNNNSAKPMNSLKIASRGSSSVSDKVATQGKQSINGMWPLIGTITSIFGPRWGKFHEGIDIAAPTGSDIVAFMSGKVIFSGWDSGGYGNLVIIDNGNGLHSYYGHNSKLDVSAGQNVSKGQHISDVGSTGDSTGPHCHFEIRKNGVQVNPANYLN